MSTKEKQELSALIEQATAGDKAALETVLTGVQDLVFNLSLRMLGSFHDAEDASQDILLKVMTHLSSFKGESSFTTWVFRIAVNHLKDYKKHMFAQFPLSFEFYGDDIRNGKIQDVPDLTQNVERAILAEELKLSCTNVIKPGGQSFLGGGLFADMFKDATRMVRDYISEHGGEWEAIITAPSFQERFTVDGSALKNVPAGYEKEHPQAEYLIIISPLTAFFAKGDAHLRRSSGTDSKFPHRCPETETDALYLSTRSSGKTPPRTDDCRAASTQPILWSQCLRRWRLPYEWR